MRLYSQDVLDNTQKSLGLERKKNLHYDGRICGLGRFKI